MSVYNLFSSYPRLNNVSSKNEAQAEITVAVARAIIVAISRTAVTRIVVPAAATIDSIRAAYDINPL